MDVICYNNLICCVFEYYCSLSQRKKGKIEVNLDFKDFKDSTEMGFEPTHGDRIGLAVQRLNHSATLSW